MNFSYLFIDCCQFLQAIYSTTLFYNLYLINFKEMEIISFENILVPFDFGTKYYNSLMVAKELAIKLGAKITIVSVKSIHHVTHCNNIIAANSLSFVVNSTLQEHEKNIYNYLEKYCLLPFINKIHVSYDNWIDVILDAVKQRTFDLLIVPDYNKNSFDRITDDFNSLQLIKKTKIPVIALNTSIINYNIKRVVLPVRDTFNWFDKVPVSATIAQITGAKIYVIGLSNSALIHVTNKIHRHVSTVKQYLTTRSIDNEVVEKYS